MQSNIVTVLVRTQLLPESIEQGKKDLLNLALEVRRVEPDCLAIELAQDLDDPKNITMIEKWSSRDAYEGPHMQSSHMKSFIEIPASILLVRQTFRFFTPYKSMNDNYIRGFCLPTWV